MQNKTVALLCGVAFSLSAHLHANAQKLAKLEVPAGQTYVVEAPYHLQVDTLILHDNASIQFAPATLGKLEAKAAYIGSGCEISAKGKDGDDGRRGLSSRNGAAGSPKVSRTISPDGEDGSPGENGQDAGYLELYLHFISLGNLRIDTRGGDGGAGGSGGNGFRGSGSEIESRTGTNSQGSAYTYNIEVPGRLGGFGGNAAQGGSPGNGGNLLLVFSSDNFIPIFNHGANKNGIDILYMAGQAGANGEPGRGGYNASNGEKATIVLHEKMNGRVALINMAQNLSTSE